MSNAAGAPSVQGHAATARTFMELVGQVVAPTAVLVALLFYFGWVRTNAIFGHFGVDQRLLAYSREDYLLRSAGVAFRPTVLLLLSVAAAFLGYLALRTLLQHLTTRRRRVALIAVACAGCLALLVAVSQVLGVGLPSPSPAVGAFLLGAGAAALEGAASLADWQEWRLLRRLVLGGVVLVSLFWSFAVAAQTSGDRLARFWAANPTSRPAITVVSREDLGLEGPGVTVERMTMEAAPADPGPRRVPAYRYTGLRLLIYSNDRWFLLPEDWGQGGDRVVFVLGDSPSLRIETAPSGS